MQGVLLACVAFSMSMQEAGTESMGLGLGQGPGHRKVKRMKRLFKYLNRLAQTDSMSRLAQ